MADVQTNSGAAEFIFWFSVIGAGVASVSHTLLPLHNMKKLSPVCVKKGKQGQEEVSPEALWWGCYAFSAMNAGYFVNGLWAGYTGSREAKQAVLLGCGVLFECFALAWFTKGHLTEKVDYRTQGIKIAVLGAVFLFGFQLMLF